jgi:hypothetical protein
MAGKITSQELAYPYTKSELVGALISGTNLPGITWTPTYDGVSGNLASVVVTGSVTATVVYNYSGANHTGTVSTAVVAVTAPAPLATTYTETYTWSGNTVTVVSGSTLT